MTEEYHYVVRAKIVDGEFVGWYLDLDSTEAAFPLGNLYTVEKDFHHGTWDVENNLIMHLGAILAQTRESEPTTAREQSNLPPW